jgi:hypothetical protein
VPDEIGVFVRSQAELKRAQAAVEAAKLPYKVLDHHVETVSGRAAIGTMHLAKGLEFRPVAVMVRHDEAQQQRIETVAGDSDLEEVYNTSPASIPQPNSWTICSRSRADPRADPRGGHPVPWLAPRQPFGVRRTPMFNHSTEAPVSDSTRNPLLRRLYNRRRLTP